MINILHVLGNANWNKKVKCHDSWLYAGAWCVGKSIQCSALKLAAALLLALGFAINVRGPRLLRTLPGLHLSHTPAGLNNLTGPHRCREVRWQWVLRSVHLIYFRRVNSNDFGIPNNLYLRVNSAYILIILCMYASWRVPILPFVLLWQ